MRSTNQDKCWAYYQSEGIDWFDSSYARLQYVANLLNIFQKDTRRTRLQVLNVGVGNGTFEELCIKAGHEVWCLDPIEKAVRQLEERVAVHGVVGRIHDADLPAGTFSVVTMSEVLEHLPDGELESAVENVSRMLAPGGLFVGTVPYDERLRDNMAICPHCGEIFHRWGHHQSFTPQRLKRLMDRHFLPVKTWVRPFVAWNQRNWKGKSLGVLEHLLSFVGVHGRNENIVFYARKA